MLLILFNKNWQSICLSVHSVSVIVLFLDLFLNRNSKMNSIWILRSDYGNEDGIYLLMIAK